MNNTARENDKAGFWSDSSCTFFNNTASDNGLQGFYIYNGLCMLIDNIATRNDDAGFYLSSTSSTTLSHNVATDNTKYGIELSYSTDCNLTDNDMNGSGLVLWDDDYIWYSLHDITDNHVNGKSLGYFKSLNDATSDGSQYGQVILANCSYVTVANGTFDDVSIGIQLDFCANCTLSNNTVRNNVYGICIGNSSADNVVSLNWLYSNSESNGYDDGSDNSWDNGTQGNYWDDYSSSGSYLIPGDAGSVDNFPNLFDITPPEITNVPDFTYESGTTGHSILWTASDLHPYDYAIYFDTNPVRTGAWNSSSEAITIGVDGLPLGVHNYTLQVSDLVGNIACDTTFVTVEDTITPTIDSPGDIEYEEGTSNHSIIWSPSDLNPQSYIIYLDGNIETSGAWNSSSESISISVDGHSVGIYNYTIVVFDDSDNSVSDTILVIVVTPPTTTSTTTTTTPTGTTSSTDTTSGNGLGEMDTMILIAIIVGSAIIVILVLVVYMRRR